MLEEAMISMSKDANSKEAMHLKRVTARTKEKKTEENQSTYPYSKHCLLNSAKQIPIPGSLFHCIQRQDLQVRNSFSTCALYRQSETCLGSKKLQKLGNFLSDF